MTAKHFHNYAFISYSHKDAKWAEWLQKKLESYRLPSTIRKELSDNVPKHIRPVFRDESDIGLGGLETNLSAELEDSRYLIIICSPDSAQSEWVNHEILKFQSLGRSNRIIPFIVRGSPDTKDPDDQCYPPTLRDGEFDILGASLEELGKEKALIKIVSALLCLKFDQLWQRHQRRERQRRMINFSVTALLLLAVSFTGYQYWDYTRLKQFNYHEIVEKYGIPEGLFPLSEQEVSHRQSSWLLEEQRGKVRRLVQVNSVGKPITDDMRYFYRENGQLSHIETYNRFGHYRLKQTYSEDLNYLQFRHKEGFSARNLSNAASNYGNYRIEATGFRYNYDNEGRVVKKIYTNSYDQPTASSKGDYGEAYSYYQNGLNASLSYLDISGNPIPIDDIFEIRYFYNDDGRLIRVEWRDGNGDLVLNINNYAAREYENDQWGNVTKVSYLDVEGNPTWRKGGWAIQKIKYAQNGNKTEESYHGPDGQLVGRDNHQTAGAQFTYDADGNLIEWEFFDVDGKPTFGNLGYCKYQSKYDQLGQLIERSYFDVDENPILKSSGYQREAFSYDHNGNRSSEAYFGTDGKPCIHVDGYSRRTSAYDDKNNLIERAYFGVDQEPILYKIGYSKFTCKYDVRGNPIETSYFGLDGQLVRDRYGVAKWIREYDQRGNIVKNGFSGLDGEPVLRDNSFSVQELHYDEHGNLTKGEYRGIDGQLVNSKLGYAIRKQKYNDENRLIERSYYDSDGNPCLDMRGSAKYDIEYNSIGQPVKYRFYGIDGKLTMLPEGYAISRLKYDHRANNIESSFYDDNGLPCLTTSNFSRSVRVYDEMRNLVEVTFFGINGERILSNNGYSRRITKYDEKGLQVGSTRYDVDDNELIERSKRDNLSPRSNLESDLKKNIQKVISAQGKNDLAVASAVSELARFYLNKRRYLEAEKLYRRAVEITKSQPEIDPSRVARSLANLARTLRRSDKLPQSEEVYLEIKKIVETHYEYYDRANLLWLEMNNILRDQKRYSEAEELLDRTIKTYETNYGINTEAIVNSLRGLCEIYTQTGRYEEAEQTMLRFITVYKVKYGENDPRVPYGNLAQTYNRIGRHAEAIKWAQKSIKLKMNKHNDEDHFNLAYNYAEIARALRDLQQFEESRAMFQKAIKITEKRLGNHSRIADYFRQFSELERKAGNLGKATELIQRSVELYNETLGPDHPDTVEAQKYFDNMDGINLGG